MNAKRLRENNHSDIIRQQVLIARKKMPENMLYEHFLKWTFKFYMLTIPSLFFSSILYLQWRSTQSLAVINGLIQKSEKWAHSGKPACVFS